MVKLLQNVMQTTIQITVNSKQCYFEQLSFLKILLSYNWIAKNFFSSNWHQTMGSVRLWRNEGNSLSLLPPKHRPSLRNPIMSLINAWFWTSRENVVELRPAVFPLLVSLQAANMFCYREYYSPVPARHGGWVPPTQTVTRYNQLRLREDTTNSDWEKIQPTQTERRYNQLRLRQDMTNSSANTGASKGTRQLITSNLGTSSESPTPYEKDKVSYVKVKESNLLKQSDEK